MVPLSRAALVAVLSAMIPAGVSRAAADVIKPVTPEVSPEAAALLQLLQSISGRYVLTGQHNYPAVKDRNTVFAARHIGRTPAVFSTDWGHAREGDSDSYLARPEIVQECIRQHRRGSLITICWHAAPPTAEEPVTFRPQPGADPAQLSSVQGKLRDEQFRDLLTPGTALHARWCRQVDAVAVFLKQLEEARVPVLWRPYHEMNGGWFWWGGRTGEFSTARLYRQLFARLVHHHRLTNLLWVWSVDRVSSAGMEHENFFPGLDVVDVLSLDVYGNDFALSYYESLVALSAGKPLALAEVGNAPSLQILTQQPRWSFYVAWAGMVRHTRRSDYDVLLQDPRILNLEDPGYAEATASYRAACGLPPLSFPRLRADFSGAWVLDEERSQPGRTGVSSAPARIEVVQEGEVLRLRQTRILEFADDEVTEETLPLDGTTVPSEATGSRRLNTARWSSDGQALLVTSGGPPGPGQQRPAATTEETWRLSRGGTELTIYRSVRSPRGEERVVLVYQRR